MSEILELDDKLLYHCTLCGDFVYLTNKYLEEQPLRPIDNAIVVDEEIVDIKSTTSPGNVVYIKRKNGYEKQQREVCCRCGGVIAYHQGGKYLYILEGAVALEKK
ncbi:UPF0428 protein CXorf56 [Boothiomyces sp. JEL0866]|nr:UPF0428 protein CXorf56 [Boothiomyces sp. JEL0866]